jgi:hypothetical protein
MDEDQDVAVTEPEEVVETPPEETPAEETSTEEASPSLFDRVKQISGLDLSGKYADEDEALRGLAEAARLVGIRNEKSELFDQLNEAIKGREQEFQEWLAGEEAKAAPVVTDNGELPRSVDEYRLLQAQLFDERGQPRKDADPAAVRKVQQMNRRLQEVAYKLAVAPEEFLKPYIEPLKEEILKTSVQSSQQTIAQQRAMAEMEAITKEHADALYVGGDQNKPSPFFHKVAEKIRTLVEATGVEPNPKTYRLAIQMAQGETATPQPTRKPGKAAMRQPAVAAPTRDAGDELEKKFRLANENKPGGLTLAEVLLAKMRAKEK